MNRLRQIKKIFDWRGYVESTMSIKHTPGGELRANCINCPDDKYKLYINPDKGVFNCFKCGFHTGKFDVVDFIALNEGIPRAQAMMRLLHEYQDVTPEDLDEAIASQTALIAPVAPSTIKTIPSLPSACKVLTQPITAENKQFWDYLLSRGMTPAEVVACGTHYVPEITSQLLDSKGKYRGNLGKRVVWPVYGGQHQLVSWLSRTVLPNYSGHDKYLNCPDSEQSKTFWPYVKPKSSEAVLVEGLLDALALRRIPKVASYATFGKHISKEQIQLLKQWGVTEVTLFWDKRDAKKEMIRAVEDLKLHFQKVYVLWLKDWPRDLDAGDCLAKSDGTDILTRVLNDKVDVNTLDFTKWIIAF